MAFDFTVPENSTRDGTHTKFGGAYEILEPGWYTFAVRACYDKTQDGDPLEAKNGTPYLKILCEDVSSGTTLHHVIFLDAEKPLRLIHFLAATGNEFEAGELVTITTHMFHGKRFRGKVEVENGRNRITLTNPVPDDRKSDKKIKEEFTPIETETPPPPDPELNEDVPF